MSAAWLLLAFLLQAAGGAAPRGASISGRVTAQANGQPLPRILVTLRSADHVRQVDTTTDPDGRYLFNDVANGEYAVTADNDEHVATYLPRSVDVEIGAGASRSDVDIALTRALAIEGRVFDPLGEPLRGVNVSATHADGRTPGASMTTTDDRGAYRVYGLKPGSYRVCGVVSNGLSARAPGDGAALVRTCYPDLPVTSQDSFNIDIHMQPGDASRATPDAAAAAVTTPADSPATGTIRGVVTDKQSGRPIPRAIVRLGFRGPSRPSGDLTTGTNADGVFTFSGLTPGQYDGFVSAAGHTTASLIDRGEHVGPLSVGKDETLPVTATLPRGYAITARLVDAFDTPIAGVGVSVQTLDGRPFILAFQHSSDDLGRVRLPELPPGRYRVCAEPTRSAFSSPAVPPTKRDRLLRTCYPSAPNDAEAQPVTLDTADLDDLDIRMLRGRTRSISGVIVDRTGAPAAHASVELQTFGRGSVIGRWFNVDGNGRFRLDDIQPGAYGIAATLGADAAFVAIRAGDDDIENLVVALQKGVSVAGRIVAADPSTPAPGSLPGHAPMHLSARLDDERLPGDGSGIGTTTNSDGTFTLTGLFGRRRIDVENVPPGWFVDAIRYGGRDVIDAPIEFTDDQQPLEVVLNNHGGTISGTVGDVVDTRVARARVLLFTAPSRKDDSPRLAGSVLPVSGTYSFGPLREGDYVIVAVPADVPSIQIGDWDRIVQLAGLGERVTLAGMDRRTIDLRVTSVR